ncbi:MAG: helix-turn-helix domain-containing protein [Nitrososphaerota archaeon]|nr:helix-turn-helix domain-containing protein [Nitrososphaerota archaeon]MDG6931353.1 helix-turn-helix domain-containing protein [Nitrososphaerota archaeon]MDG6933006.1 helix-turn-helix domain-containing protein [Nitrososphaerota archaeon]MDG6935497.1 helix-turn-helix domain-containing protein [Nitrososphaerota archaeon]MDG6943525.1 helix-turn-helix domain-containing protein [Nitrososphaerota archaeon]
MLIAKLDVKHEKCWSELTERYEGSSIYSMNMIMDPNKKISYTVAYIKVQKKKELADFKKSIRENRYVGHIMDMRGIRNVINNISYYINFVGIYNDTIGSILFEEGALFNSFYFNDGIEHWVFMINSADRLQDILSKIKQLATITGLNVSKIDKDGIMYLNSIQARNILMPYLTDKQWDTLTKAFYRGYYNNPRNIKLSKLSEEFHVSPATLDERIRTSESKILDVLFNSGS